MKHFNVTFREVNAEYTPSYHFVHFGDDKDENKYHWERGYNVPAANEDYRFERESKMEVALDANKTVLLSNLTVLECESEGKKVQFAVSDRLLDKKAIIVRDKKRNAVTVNFDLKDSASYLNIGNMIYLAWEDCPAQLKEKAS